MNHLQDWENLYQQGRHMSRWPWSDLISLVKGHVKSDPKSTKVLELGSGAGANIPFFLAEGYDYTGVEGSAEAVKMLKQRFPSIEEAIVCSNFTEFLPAGPFDLVVDRASLTCNSTEQITKTLSNVLSVLSRGGTFIGVDWYSTSNDEFSKGLPGPDKMTRHGFTDGSYAEMGQVHFSDRAHLEELFAGWEWISLEEKKTTYHVPGPDYVYSSWSFVVRQPA